MKKLLNIFKKIGLIVAAIILIILIYEIGIGAIFHKKSLNYHEKVEKLENRLSFINENEIDTFICDGEFKILQLTDTHIGGGYLSGDNDYDALKTIEKLVRSSSPDLVVITGDLVFPSKTLSGNIDNLKSLQILANLMEKLEVYWAPVFGNHDSQVGSMYTRKELGNYLESLNYCMFKSGPNSIDGVGNYVINIKNSSGKIIQSLYFMDSNDYVGIKGNVVQNIDNDYDQIHTNQIEWYENQINKINQINLNNGFEGIVPSMLFMHIPFIEYETAYDESKLLFGEKNEKNCPGKNYRMFEKIVELNSTKAVFCGHDHTNNYSIKYNGIQLTYGMSIDYLAYIYTRFIGSQRGGTQIILSPDSNFQIKLYPYKDIK